MVLHALNLPQHDPQNACYGLHLALKRDHDISAICTPSRPVSCVCFGGEAAAQAAMAVGAQTEEAMAQTDCREVEIQAGH